MDAKYRELAAEEQLNRRIYVPLSCALSRMTRSKGSSEIDQVIFRTRSVDDLPVAKDIIIRHLTAAHNMSDIELTERGTERRREVGIRRAVGATERDILRQFVVEAVSICVFGGVAGVVVGAVMSKVVSLLAGYRTAIALWGILSALAVSLADGLLFGTYPAYKAGKLDPIEALRYE